jgi:hypothetical protein
VGPVRAYFGLLGMTMLNPTTVIYFAALVLGSGAWVAGMPPSPRCSSHRPVPRRLLGSCFWAGGGAVLGQVVTSKRGRLVTTVVSSLLITVLAVDLVR